MAKINGPKKIRSYGQQFKATAVKLSHLPGVQVQDVAESLDIHPFMLSRWRWRCPPPRKPVPSPARCRRCSRSRRFHAFRA